jgi:hypothetical protein
METEIVGAFQLKGMRRGRQLQFLIRIILEFFGFFFGHAFAAGTLRRLGNLSLFWGLRGIGGRRHYVSGTRRHTLTSVNGLSKDIGAPALLGYFIQRENGEWLGFLESLDHLFFGHSAVVDLYVTDLASEEFSVTGIANMHFSIANKVELFVSPLTNVGGFVFIVKE